MRRTRLAIIFTFLLVLGMGAWAGMAIRRTAGRRATLVDAIAARVPPVAGARVLGAWAPLPDADLVHATYCLDDTDPSAGAERFRTALASSGWRVDAAAQAPDTRAGVVGLSLSTDGYRLRGHLQPGRRPDCDGARRQIVLSLEAAPAR